MAKLDAILTGSVQQLSRDLQALVKTRAKGIQRIHDELDQKLRAREDEEVEEVGNASDQKAAAMRLCISEKDSKDKKAHLDYRADCQRDDDKERQEIAAVRKRFFKQELNSKIDMPRLQVST